MKTTLSIAPTLLALALPFGAYAAAPAVGAGAEWSIDSSHASAGFAIRHMMVNDVHGELGKITGKAVIDDQQPSRSKVEVEIDAAGVNTRDDKRDQHLRSPDFFDVQKFPQLRYRSTSVSKGKDGAWTVNGELTLHGVTRPVALQVSSLTDTVQDPWGNERRGVHATASIDRKEFGLLWNAALDKGGAVLGDTVQITIDLELLRPSGSPAKKS
jgi:polyisoprenoid-binding protein YceI